MPIIAQRIMVPVGRSAWGAVNDDAWGWTWGLVTELKRSVQGMLLLHLQADDQLLQLGVIRVSLDERGQGHGERILARICAEADACALVTACTPTGEYGADP